MSDPVSWYLIEPGWKVVAAGGTLEGTGTQSAPGKPSARIQVALVP